TTASGVLIPAGLQLDDLPLGEQVGPVLVDQTHAGVVCSHHLLERVASKFMVRLVVVQGERNSLKPVSQGAHLLATHMAITMPTIIRANPIINAVESPPWAKPCPVEVKVAAVAAMPAPPAAA